MSNTIPPTMSYGMALLEIHQQSRREQDLMGDALHEYQKAHLVVGTIYDGLANAEKETQRNLAYVGAALAVVSIASSAADVGQATQATTTTDPVGPTLEEKDPESILSYVKEGSSIWMQAAGDMSSKNEALFVQASESQDVTAEHIGETKDLLRDQDAADRDFLVQLLKAGMLRVVG